MPATSPATCEATSTPCEGISVPMAGSRSIHSSVFAASAVIVAGGGTCEAKNPLIICGMKTSLKNASPPIRALMITRAIRKRFIMVRPPPQPSA
ncbi:MAG: hypothetical protein WDN31_12710 [Hyphomicrobium sp.]